DDDGCAYEGCRHRRTLRADAAIGEDGGHVKSSSMHSRACEDKDADQVPESWAMPYLVPVVARLVLRRRTCAVHDYVAVWMQAALARVIFQPRVEERQREQQYRNSEDHECYAPAVRCDQALHQHRNDDGANADSHHRERHGETAAAIEPVRDDRAVGHGRRAAGHRNSQDRKEQIELPEAAAHPPGGAEHQSEQQGGNENHTPGAEAVDEGTSAWKPERADEIEEGKGK